MRAIFPLMSVRPMHCAPALLWSSLSGSMVPSTETPVRITSIGCALFGMYSSADLTAAGRARRVLRQALYSFSSSRVGSFSCTSR